MLPDRANQPAPVRAPGPLHARLAEAVADASVPGGRLSAFAYLDTPSTHRYRQLMAVFLANKRAFGLRLAPDLVAHPLSTRFAVPREPLETLERELDQLCAWGALDRLQ